MDISQFHFLRPQWWLALLPLAILLWAFAHRQSGAGKWLQIVDPQLLPHVVEGLSPRGRWGTLAALALGGLLAITALAGPTWSRLPQPVYRISDAVVIALDLSRSMEATDLKPNRLTRARFKIADLVNKRREGQTALIVYAGTAHVVTPLTDDTATIAAQLPALSPELMPSRGSRADIAIKRAGQLMEQAGVRQGRVLLVTDGVDKQRAMEAAQQLRASGYRLDVLGIGTRQGSPIPLKNGAYLHAADGSIVIPRLDRDQLATLAAAGDGRFRAITANDEDIQTLSDTSISTDFQETTEHPDLKTDLWRDEGPWLLLPLLLLAALAFRRGWLFIVLFVAIPLPQPGYAMDWSSFWKRSDQRASEAFAEGDTARAAELFTDPAWRGVAEYRAGHYAKALEALDGLEDAQSWYNRGNTLARMGRYPEAIAAYDQALSIDSNLEDARYNRELLQQQLSAQDSAASQGSDRNQREGQPTPQGDASQLSQTNPGDAGNHQTEPSDQAPGEAQHLQAGSPDAPTSQDASTQGLEQDPLSEHEDSSAAEARDEEESLGQNAEENSPAGVNRNRTVQGVDPRTSHGDSEQTPDEAEQALTQWMRRIPDDPGGLLRRKFQYQYRRQSQAPINDSHPW